MVAGGAALVFVWRSGYRAAAGLFALASGLSILVARVAGVWPAVPPDVPGRIVVLAAAFLAPATAFTLWGILARVRLSIITTIGAVIILLLAGWADGRGRPLGRLAHVASEPLVIGFNDDQLALIADLRLYTTADARVLWDETPGDRTAWNWSALLPLLTDRPFLGGLDPESGVEYSYCAMCNRQLTGRILKDWSDADLEAFCRWYNVGWVVARVRRPWSDGRSFRWQSQLLIAPRGGCRSFFMH